MSDAPSSTDAFSKAPISFGAKPNDGVESAGVKPAVNIFGKTETAGQPNTATTSSLFGGLATNKDTFSKPSTLFGAKPSTVGETAGDKPAANNVFGNIFGKTDTSAAKSTSGAATPAFSFGVKPGSDTPSSPVATETKEPDVVAKADDIGEKKWADIPPDPPTPSKSDAASAPPEATPKASSNSEPAKTVSGDVDDAAAALAAAELKDKEEEAAAKKRKDLEDKRMRELIMSQPVNEHGLKVFADGDPMKAIKTFDELAQPNPGHVTIPPDVRQGIKSMNWNEPTKIQESAIPALLQEPPRSVIFQAQTGTGKTGSFAIAILSRINRSYAGVQAICCADTKLLVNQTAGVLSQLSGGKVTVTEHYGGDKDAHGNIIENNKLQFGQQIKEQILCITTGKLRKYVEKQRGHFDVTKVQTLVVDEADVQLGEGNNQQDLEIIKKKLLAKKPDIQFVCLSATFSDEILSFCHSYVSKGLKGAQRSTVPKFVSITLPRDEQIGKRIRHMYMICRGDEGKRDAINRVMLNGNDAVNKAIVFCETRAGCESLKRHLDTEGGFDTQFLHGKVSVAEQIKLIQKFKKDAGGVLVTTNVMSRGIDIPNVTVVFNYDLPVFSGKHNSSPTPHLDPAIGADTERYLHRSGRTARAGAIGHCINLINVEARDNCEARRLQEIEKHFPGLKINDLGGDDDEWDEILAVDKCPECSMSLLGCKKSNCLAGKK